MYVCVCVLIWDIYLYCIHILMNELIARDVSYQSKSKYVYIRILWTVKRLNIMYLHNINDWMNVYEWNTRKWKSTMCFIFCTFIFVSLSGCICVTWNAASWLMLHAAIEVTHMNAPLWCCCFNLSYFFLSLLVACGFVSIYKGTCTSKHSRNTFTLTMIDNLHVDWVAPSLFDWCNYTSYNFIIMTIIIIQYNNII